MLKCTMTGTSLSHQCDRALLVGQTTSNPLFVEVGLQTDKWNSLAG